MKPVRLLIVGPPGAGKGTQATMIAERYGIPAISTGDIFRANIKNQTELGKQIEAIVSSGSYVPDELTNAIVADRLTESDAQQGFLLDGYPRTVEQVHELDRMLAAQEATLDAVVLLEADIDEVVQRLLKRASEQGRADDTEEVIRHRQEVYAEQTQPLIDVFDQRGIVLRVDGLGLIEAVAERISALLSEKLGH